ncbi:HAMP domain-containing sensor histidine kinase [uncultured Senegalimassilia sp.]|uniref:sensor histidine kinase n=1 Tax=uncultured Senegalimassilia sp. TaxID=1714350 RepID=UPI0026384175|nr:HAMP domain-containing sensor histidine kinase [uncultured Senegalimassilia sp.]
MLKKLRIKFIALNMATVAVVLTVIFTTICVVNHRQSVAAVDGALNQAIAQAAEHQSRQMGKDALGEGQPDGEQPAPADGGSDGSSSSDGQKASAQVAGQVAGFAEADAAVGWENAAVEALAGSADQELAVADSSDVAAPPTIGGRERDGGQVIPMALFSVSVDGAMTALGRYNTASISQDVLEQAGQQLAGADEGFGSLSDLGLFYVKRQAGGVMYLAFADMGSASGWRSLAATLAVVEVAALAVFFVISLFFSRWALRPVARAWTQQRRFVADASHDLKTPLTVILANTSIALEHPERSVASQSQWLESTQHEAEAMQSLVGDLLALAKMDEEEAAAQSGAARPAFEEVDLSDVLEGEVLQFESVAFERGVRLESQVEPGIELRGNEQRLRRLAGTLIDNACKYVDDGGAVNVSLSRAGKQAKLEVRNTGAPISPEDLPHVFDRFYRADKARTGGAGGHGLGLAIARAIAEEHGGTLTVSSTQADGTVFTATLPLK